MPNSVFKSSFQGNMPEEYANAKNSFFQAAGFSDIFDTVMAKYSINFGGMINNPKGSGADLASWNLIRYPGAITRDSLTRDNIRDEKGKIIANRHGLYDGKEYRYDNGRLVEIETKGVGRNELKLGDIYFTTDDKNLILQMGFKKGTKISRDLVDELKKAGYKDASYKDFNTADGCKKLLKFIRGYNARVKNNNNEIRKYVDLMQQKENKSSEESNYSEMKGAMKDYLEQEMMAGYYRQFLDFTKDVISATGDDEESDSQFEADLSSKFSDYLESETLNRYFVQKKGSDEPGRFISDAKDIADGEEFVGREGSEDGAYYQDSKEKNSLRYMREIFKAINKYSNSVDKFIKDNNVDTPGVFDMRNSKKYVAMERVGKFLPDFQDAMKEASNSLKDIKKAIDSEDYKNTRVQEMVKKWAQDRNLYNMHFIYSPETGKQQDQAGYWTFSYSGAGEGYKADGDPNATLDYGKDDKSYHMMFDSQEEYKNKKQYNDFLANIKSASSAKQHFLNLQKYYEGGDDEYLNTLMATYAKAEKYKKVNPENSIFVSSETKDSREAFLSNIKDGYDSYSKRLKDSGNEGVVAKFFELLSSKESGDLNAIAAAANLLTDEQLRNSKELVRKYGMDGNLVESSHKDDSYNYQTVYVSESQRNVSKGDHSLIKNWHYLMRQSVRELKENFIDIWANYDYSLHGKKSRIAYLANFNMIGIGARPTSPQRYLTMNNAFTDPDSRAYKANVGYLYNFLAEVAGMKKFSGKTAGGRSVRTFTNKETGESVNITDIFNELQSQINKKLSDSSKSEYKHLNIDFVKKATQDSVALGFKEAAEDKKGKGGGQSGSAIKFRNAFISLQGTKTSTGGSSKKKFSKNSIWVSFIQPYKSYPKKLYDEKTTFSRELNQVKRISFIRFDSGSLAVKISCIFKKSDEEFQVFRRNIGCPCNLIITFSGARAKFTERDVYLDSFNATEIEDDNLDCLMTFVDYTYMYPQSRLYGCLNCDTATDKYKAFSTSLKPMCNDGFYPVLESKLSMDLSKAPITNYIIDGDSWGEVVGFFADKYGRAIINSLENDGSGNDTYILKSEITAPPSKSDLENSRARSRKAKWLQMPFVENMTVEKNLRPNFLASSTITSGFFFDVNDTHEGHVTQTLYRFPPQYNATSSYESQLISNGISSLHSTEPHKLSGNDQVLRETVRASTMEQEYKAGNVSYGGAGNLLGKFKGRGSSVSKSTSASDDLIISIFNMMGQSNLFLENDLPLFTCYSVDLYNFDTSSTGNAGVFFRSTATGESSIMGLRGLHGSLGTGTAKGMNTGFGSSGVTRAGNAKAMAFMLYDKAQYGGVDPDKAWESVPTELVAYFPFNSKGSKGKVVVADDNSVVSLSGMAVTPGDPKFVREVFYTNASNAGAVSFSSWKIELKYSLRFIGSEYCEVQYDVKKGLSGNG